MFENVKSMLHFRISKNMFAPCFDAHISQRNYTALLAKRSGYNSTFSWVSDTTFKLGNGLFKLMLNANYNLNVECYD